MENLVCFVLPQFQNKVGLLLNFCVHILKRENNSILEQKYGTFNSNVNCDSTNIVYMIECKKDRCKQRYMGETDNELRKRITQHRRYKHLNLATGYHINLPGVVCQIL